MDADKRHDLKSNELAEALAKLRNLGSDRQTLYWLLALLIVVVAFAGYRFWSRARQAHLTTAWAKLSQYEQRLASDPDASIEGLRTLGGEAANPTLAAAARLRAAAALRERAFAQPDRQQDLLEESLATLRLVTEPPGTPPALVAAALFSMGTSYESLRQLDQAAQVYQRIVNESQFAGTPVREEAADRLASLDELRTPVAFVPGLPPPPTTQRVVTPARVFPQTQPTDTQPGLVPVPPAPASRPAPVSEPPPEPQPEPPPDSPPATQPSGAAPPTPAP
jgi:predicted negative regulator of RcsB-dependent stress response